MKTHIDVETQIKKLDTYTITLDFPITGKKYDQNNDFLSDISNGNIMFKQGIFDFFELYKDDYEIDGILDMSLVYEDILKEIYKTYKEDIAETLSQIKRHLKEKYSKDVLEDKKTFNKLFKEQIAKINILLSNGFFELELSMKQQIIEFLHVETLNNLHAQNLDNITALAKKIQLNVELPVDYIQTKQKLLKQSKNKEKKESIKQEWELYKKYNATIILKSVLVDNWELYEQNFPHRMEDIKEAIKIVKSHWLNFGLTHIVGVVQEEREEYLIIEDIKKLKPKVLVISPLVVLKSTMIAKNVVQGKFKTLNLQEQRYVISQLVQMINNTSIEKVLLKDNFQKYDESDYLSGAKHQQEKDYQISLLYFELIRQEVKKMNAKTRLICIKGTPFDKRYISLSQNLSNDVIQDSKEKIQSDYDIIIQVKSSTKNEQAHFSKLAKHLNKHNYLEVLIEK